MFLYSSFLFSKWRANQNWLFPFRLVFSYFFLFFNFIFFNFLFFIFWLRHFIIAEIIFESNSNFYDSPRESTHLKIDSRLSTVWHCETRLVFSNDHNLCRISYAAWLFTMLGKAYLKIGTVLREMIRGPWNSVNGTRKKFTIITVSLLLLDAICLNLDGS